MKGIWPLEGSRPNVSAEAAFAWPKHLRCACRGHSSRQSLSCGDGKPLHGSRPPPEPQHRPAISPYRQSSGPGNEPIKRLPEPPDFSVGGPAAVRRALCTEQAKEPSQITASKSEDRQRKSREVWASMKGIWPLEGPRPNVSAEAAFAWPKRLRCACRGHSSRRCLSCGDGEAPHGSRPPPEPQHRPAISPNRQSSGPGSEPIMRLPEPPDFSVGGPAAARRALCPEQAKEPNRMQGRRSDDCQRLFRRGIPRQCEGLPPRGPLGTRLNYAVSQIGD